MNYFCIIVFLSCFPQLIVGFCQFYNKDKACSMGQSEIYRDVSPDGSVSKQCCAPDSEQGKQLQQKINSGCFLTECIPKSKLEDGIDLCPNRTAKGRNLNLKEVTRDPCEDEGRQALCCSPDSKAGLLTLELRAEKGEFPFYAKLDSGGGTCGATIYNKRHLITSSKCVLNEKGKLKKAGKGKIFVDVNIYNTFGKSYDVESYFVHPNSGFWDNFTGNYISDDLAIVRLQKDIQFSDKVQAIGLPEKGFNPLNYSDEAIILGVGSTDTLTGAFTLQKANSMLQTFEEEKEKEWKKNYGQKEIYVGGAKDGKLYPFPGPGDSGGPMVCRDSKGFAVLCGAFSSGWSIENCEKNLNAESCKPAKYMRISNYVDWITKVGGSQRGAKLFKQEMYGKTVGKNEFTNQVRILRHGMDPCGGTLIERDLIATAAHCVFDNNGNVRKDVSIYFGVRNAEGGKRGREFSIKGRKALEGFRKGQRKVKRIARFNMMATPKEPYYQNNLALVRLSGPAVTSSVKLPKIGTATRSNYDENPIWTTEVSLPLLQIKHGEGNFQQREFKLLDNKTCQKRLDMATFAGYKLHLDDNIMCGLEKFNGGSQCDRELGGGLFCDGPEGKASVLCGVQVFRFCQLAMPGAYLDISQYAKWINSVKLQI